MSDFVPLRVAVVGCGNISGAYGSSLKTKPDLVKIIGAFDVIADQAKAFVNNYDGHVYNKLEDVMADPEVELVINLTSHHAHAEVSSMALAAGKHVHSEKPLATKREDGKKLLELAEKHKVRLSCSPFTFLGESQQTVRKVIHESVIGKPLIAYAEMNWSWIELWHPNPEGFHQPGAGPMLDVGVYPLTILTAILGPVVKALGYAEILLPERTIGSGPKAGTKYKVTTPDQVIGILTFASGCKARITTNFFGFSRQGGIEFHGETGSLILDTAVDFGSKITVRNIGDNDWRTIPFIAEPFGGVEWGRAVFELAESLRKGTPQRCTGQQAYHVLDICLSILDSAEKGCAVPVESTFIPPQSRY